MAGGVEVLYRESGPADSPVILLLHGFSVVVSIPGADASSGRSISCPRARSSRLWFHRSPEPRGYVYSFDSLARTILAFIDILGLERYALYVFDYRAPVGFRIAMTRPDYVTAIVSQNGNAKAWEMHGNLSSATGAIRPARTAKVDCSTPATSPWRRTSKRCLWL